MKKITLSILLGLFAFNISFSQHQQDALHSCALCIEGKHTNENPYDLSLKKELPFIATGLGLFGTGVVLAHYNNTQPFTTAQLNALDRNDINKFDRAATYNHSESARVASNYIAYSSIALPLLFLGEHYARSDFFNLFIMGLEVGSINTGLTEIAKNLANRPRPYTYNSDFTNEIRSDKESKLSFFSGHTSTTTAYSFFFAKVINDYHPNMKKGYKIGLWSFAAILPATTAYLRVEAGKHYSTDVITGYAIGALVGWAVPELHKKRKKEKSMSVLPYNYNGYSGLTFNWKINTVKSELCIRKFITD